jgi:ATP citrate (pro-S)-lyase
VVYADTISDLGFAQELANYGEYSGAPSTEHTFEYAKTLIGLMTRERDPRGKIFIIGGSIANFTDVAATFSGLIKAIKAYSDVLRTHNASLILGESVTTYFAFFSSHISFFFCSPVILFWAFRSRFGFVGQVRTIRKGFR